MKLNFFRRKQTDIALPEGAVRLKISEARLSVANVTALKEEYQSQVEGKSAAVLVLDQLTFMDSSGLGFLVAMRNSLQPPKRMVLEGIVDPTVISLIQLTRMDQVFLIAANSAESKRLLAA